MVAMNNNLTDKRQGSQYKKLIFFFFLKNTYSNLEEGRKSNLSSKDEKKM
jgi:hypothetical protein